MTGLFRTLSIGAALLAFAAICDASASVNAAEVASQAAPPKHHVRKAIEIGARRHDRDYAAAPAGDGYYYDRPVDYRPYPYVVPAPFFLGLAFAPPW